MAMPIGEAAARLEESFRDLYESEAKIVLRYLRASVADSAQAEDLCGETFFRAWQAWRGFRGGPAEARAWLLRIARNLVIDQARRRRLLRFLPVGDDLAGPDEPAVDAIERIDLERALARLSSGDRDLLAMRAAGLTHLEIARVQARTEPAVKMAWHRALQRLREQMEGNT
jgi:RNA polymerase sigma-70 factor, ECF subfamily